MKSIDVVIEHDVDKNELEIIAKELNGFLSSSRIIIDAEKNSYIRLPSKGITYRTRSDADYYFDYKDRDKLYEIRKIATYRTITLVNIDNEDEIKKIKEILHKHGIFEYDYINKESPFVINGNRFKYAKKDSIEDDMEQELFYHHGNGSLYEPGFMLECDSLKAKHEFIEWLGKTIPHSWYYDQNWNYVSYIAATDSTLDGFKNPKTLSLFPAEMKEKIEKNDAYIVAAMVCTKTGIKNYDGEEYVCIQDIITRVRGIGLSRLLFYKYLRIESGYVEYFGSWEPKIELIPGDITNKSSVPFWYRMVGAENISENYSYMTADMFYERSKRLAKHKELDKNWEMLYEYMSDIDDANIIFPRLKEYLCDGDEYYYSKVGDDKILIAGVDKEDKISEHDFKDENIKWQGPIEINSVPYVKFEDHYGGTAYISFNYYQDCAEFIGEEEAIHRIWSVFECIRIHGNYDENIRLKIECEEEGKEEDDAD